MNFDLEIIFLERFYFLYFQISLIFIISWMPFKIRLDFQALIFIYVAFLVGSNCGWIDDWLGDEGGESSADLKSVQNEWQLKMVKEEDHHMHGQHARSKQSDECVSTTCINMIIHVEAEVVQVEESDPILLCDWSVAAVRMELICDPDGQDHVKSDSGVSKIL